MGAILSPCELYRYRLERIVADAGPVVAYFGVNPSTADATIDDQTVKKWRGFTKLIGGSRFIVGNIFAFRATDVRDLSAAEDPLGPENERHLRALIDEADLLVPCWGRLSKVPMKHRAHLHSLVAMLTESRKPMLHFGLTTCGQPKHPQMLGYSTPMLPWASSMISTPSPRPQHGGGAE